MMNHTLSTLNASKLVDAFENRLALAPRESRLGRKPEFLGHTEITKLSLGSFLEVSNETYSSTV